MRKLFFVLATGILFSSNVLAGNFFCEDKDSDDSMCIKISHIMYQGLLEGYSERAKEYSKEKGLDFDKKMVIEEAMELIPYDAFLESFKKCGESKTNINDAQACIFSDLYKLSLKNSEKKSQ